MKLSEVGEFGLINRIASRFSNLLLPGIKGIGDDCAVIPAGNGCDLVITTDMLVEDVHFLRERVSPRDLGHKSLAVNLSDIAAMGAVPLGSFLSIAIPASIEVEYVDQLMEGYYNLSQEARVPLLGGDTTRSGEKLVINVCAIGSVTSGKAKTRDGARGGDVIAVTGFLGNSAAGLQAIKENLPPEPEIEYLIKSHDLPVPHLQQGKWLGNNPYVNSMIDISDGIASDLIHVLNASGKSAYVNIEQLPISPQLLNVANRYNFDAFTLATRGGEDYCLLLTIHGEKFEEVSSDYLNRFNEPLVKIGGILEGLPSISWFLNGISVNSPGKGFNHFV